MKIGIYNDALGGIGGSEYCAAVLAEAFEREHDVTLIHHKQQLTREALAEAFSVRLDRASFQYRPPDRFRATEERLPWRRLRELRAWQADLSSPFDVYFGMAHGMPPFCHAKQGVLLVVFPYFDRANLWPWNDQGPGTSLRARLRRAYYDWDWQRRFATYRQTWGISEYTAHWTRRRWAIDCEIVYPPVDIRGAEGSKERLILSVGRFTPRKKQLEMLNAFRAVSQTALKGWTFCCVGGLTDTPTDRDYYAKLQESAAQCDAKLVANADRASLDDLLRRASIFWHAMGWGEDPEERPQMMEHFGIVTVEAMAAGCVPVVVNRGGQPEIVEHGVSGFVWDAVSELTELTVRLAKDEALRDAMSRAARSRAERFSRQRFVDRCAEFVQAAGR
jgi:L-malate glycosyltransferase